MSGQKVQIDAALAELGVTAHITHLRQPEDAYFKVVTVATPDPVRYGILDAMLSSLYNEAYLANRSDIGTVIIEGFASTSAGVALCHHRDNFGRKLGCIIAEGRLLKLLKQEAGL